jgi:hypothetical protein
MASSSSSSLVRPKPRSKNTTSTSAAANTNSSRSKTSANTSTASSSKDSANIQQPKPVTHSNTDAHCLPDKHNRVQHWLYLARLYNGFYMLTAREQFFCHIAGWMVAVMAGLYLYVFVRGFMDGFQQHLMIVEA